MQLPRARRRGDQWGLARFRGGKKTVGRPPARPPPPSGGGGASVERGRLELGRLEERLVLLRAHAGDERGDGVERLVVGEAADLVVEVGRRREAGVAAVGDELAAADGL